jgi:hypothetical protein
MASDRLQLAIQAHLAEYVALRQEMLEMIKWRERLVFFSLGISGALFSFALSADPSTLRSPTSRRLALYAVAPLAAAVGCLWLVNAQRIYRIGVYIRDVLASKINGLLAGPASPGQTSMFEAFSWESSSQRVMKKWSRRALEQIVLLFAFVVAGLSAQYAIIADQEGSIFARVRAVEHPVWYLANCLLASFSLALFVRHFWYGRKSKGSPMIRS